MADASGSFGADFSQQPPRPPEDVELKNIIDKLANFVARNGPEFEQMTMNKQRDNAKFHFLFGGEWHGYYKWRVMTEQQQGQGTFHPPPGGGGGGGALGSQIPPLIRPLMSMGTYPQLPPNMPPFPPPLFGGPRGFPPGFVPNMPPPPLLPPAAQLPPPTSSQQLPSNAPWQQQQQQQQAPPPVTQTTPSGPTHQLQLVRQELQNELETYGVTDPMEIEFGSVVKRLMESCTKDSIASGKSWIVSHSHLPNECAKVAKFLLRKTLDGAGVGFSEKLHIIYLINDVIHHCVRKGAQDLLQAVEDLIVQIVYNVHCSSVDNPEALRKVLKIWDDQKYFTDSVLQQIRAIVTDETEERKGSEDSDDRKTSWQDGTPQPPPPAAPQPHPWDHPRDQQPPWQQQPQQGQSPRPPWQPPPQPDQQPAVPVPPWQQDQQHKPPPVPWQQQSGAHPWEKQPEPNKPPMLPWEQQQPPPPHWPHPPDGPRPPRWTGPPGGPPGAPPPPWQQGPPLRVGEPTPLFPPTQPGDPPPPSSHGSPSTHPPPSQDGPQEERQIESGPPPPHPQDAERNEVVDGDSNGVGDTIVPTSCAEGSPDPARLPPPPTCDEDRVGHQEDDGRMQSFDYQHGRPFGRRFDEDDGPPPPREIFEYNHRPPHWDMPPPPPHLPQMGPGMPFDAWGPPPPHLHPPPDLPPPIPYYDLPAGLMVAVVPLFEHGYRPLDPCDIHLPPPQPPSERLLHAVEDFYKTSSDDKSRNEEGWEARALLDFFEAKHRAKNNRYRPMRRLPPRRPRSRSRSRSYSRSPPRRRRSRSYSRSRSRSPRPLQSRSRSRSPPRCYSDGRSRSHSPHHSRHRRSRSRSPFIPIAEDRPLNPPPQAVAAGSGDSRIGGSNVGHQLLKKMGWEEGAGLGLNEQGIQEPIKGGDVRDKNDKYKGVGMDMKDPFELFRKNKSYTFSRSRGAPAPPSPP